VGDVKKKRKRKKWRQKELRKVGQQNVKQILWE